VEFELPFSFSVFRFPTASKNWIRALNSIFNNQFTKTSENGNQKSLFIFRVTLENEIRPSIFVFCFPMTFLERGIQTSISDFTCISYIIYFGTSWHPEEARKPRRCFSRNQPTPSLTCNQLSFLSCLWWFCTIPFQRPTTKSFLSSYHKLPDFLS